MIPIYRAKKINSNEWFEGSFLNIEIDSEWEDVELYKGYYIVLGNANRMVMVDLKTLSINFPNMLDKNGKKIFASLSEDGIGGDILSNSFRDGNNGTSIVMLINGQLFLKSESGCFRPYNDDNGWCSITELRYGGIETIGINKG